MKISFSPLASLLVIILNPASAKFCQKQITKLFSKGLIGCCSFVLASQSYIYPASAIDADTARFSQGLKELQNLDANWDGIVKGQGDNIRRKLGTVYSPPVCESPLCGFSNFVPKFVKSHDDIDLPEFEEPSSDLLEQLNQADFLAYSSVFADYGNGGGQTSEDYIKESRAQVKKAIVSMKKVIDVLEK